jgi:hypothetical protein
MELKDTGYRPKQVKLSTIVDRLMYLEGGLEEEEDLMYKSLYGTFLKDPDKYFNPHKAMEKQITDLIVVLSLPTWIDFSNKRNQTVGKFFFDASFSDKGPYHKFFYQLVLSMELDLRINEKHHADVPKQRLISQLPPRVAWSLAVARRWRECVRLQPTKGLEPVLTRDQSFGLTVVRRYQIKTCSEKETSQSATPVCTGDEMAKSRRGSEDPSRQKCRARRVQLGCYVVFFRRYTAWNFSSLASHEFPD